MNPILAVIIIVGFSVGYTLMMHMVVYFSNHRCWPPFFGVDDE